MISVIAFYNPSRLLCVFPLFFSHVFLFSALPCATGHDLKETIWLNKGSNQGKHSPDQISAQAFLGALTCFHMAAVHLNSAFSQSWYCWLWPRRFQTSVRNQNKQTMLEISRIYLHSSPLLLDCGGEISAEIMSRLKEFHEINHVSCFSLLLDEQMHLVQL